MVGFVYGIFDPLYPAVVRYVGYTSKTLQYRLSQHLAEAKKRKCHRHHWLMMILRRGDRPGIIALESVTAENWQDRERSWIASLSGNNLVNGTSGGDGLINPSDDIRGRISAKVSVALAGNDYRLGVPHTEASRAAISAGLRSSAAKRASDASRKGRAGRPLTEEEKAKLRAAKLGLKRPDVSARLMGNTYGSRCRHTDEHKQKVAERNRLSVGVKWITDGSENRRLMPDKAMPDGWRFGLTRSQSA